VNYLLDTNACIAIINANPVSVRARVAEAVSSGSQIFVSAVAAFELWYGVAKSSRPAANAERVEAFFAGPVSILPFEDDDAPTAGRLRADLERAGTPIGAYDLLIAAQARNRRLTLITANVKEFRRVKDLSWEDWARP